MSLVLSYTLFAILSIITNIFFQDLTTRVYQGSFQIIISIFMGTLAGLLVKYWLDKKYIFRYKAENTAQDFKTFILYSVAGIFTTIIFWSFEFAFELAFETKFMRYFGGVIGLAIGYFIKYFLDKKYVFKAQ